VTATDSSPKVEKDKTSGQTSFETASSGSRFSSPPSIEQVKSSASDIEANSPENNENVSQNQTKTFSALKLMIFF